jgi:hypothetical protein
MREIIWKKDLMERLNCDRKTIEKLKIEENLPLRSFSPYKRFCYTDEYVQWETNRNY